MRRMTKCVAVMLAMTCAMTMAPQNTEASIFGTLIDLTDGPILECPLLVLNDTGRPVRIRMWSNHGEYDKDKLDSGRYVCGMPYTSRATWFAVEAAVWNKNKKKYVVMDYVEGPAFQDYVFYKHAQGDFRLAIWED